MVDQGPGHGCPLLFAAGDFCRIFFPDMRNLKNIAEVIGCRFHGMSAWPAMIRGSMMFSRTVRPSRRRKSWKTKTKLLVADFCQGLFDRLARDSPPSDASFLERDITGDTVQQCGLAGARGPHDCHEFSLFDCKRDAF